MSEARFSESTKRPSLRSIAAQAGVAHATVSMALRNDPEIPQKTRERVRRIANKMGYRPDPQVAKLMRHLQLLRRTGITATIAAITDMAESAEPRYAVELRRGAQQAAEALGYRLEVFRVSVSDKRSSSLQRILRSRGVDGVLLLPMTQALSMTNFLDWSCFSVVAATYGILAPDFHRVVPDHFGNAIVIGKHLAEIGHRRIGLVTDRRTDRVVAHRFSAALTWFNALDGVVRVVPHLYEGNYRTGLRSWFEQQRPDAIVAGTETDAVDIASELELEPSAHVRFAVTDHAGSRRFSGIDQRPETIGSAAIGQLHAQIQSGDRGSPKAPSVMMIKGRWVTIKSAATCGD